MIGRRVVLMEGFGRAEMVVANTRERMNDFILGDGYG